MNDHTNRIYHRLNDRIVALRREIQFLEGVRDELVRMERDLNRAHELDAERAAAIREMNGL